MIESKVKLNFRNAKLMKKFYGQNLGREIAFGRKLVKMIKKNYNTKEILLNLS
jgi:hypothetical protein